jgi:hypothetical protein
MGSRITHPRELAALAAFLRRHPVSSDTPGRSLPLNAQTQSDRPPTCMHVPAYCPGRPLNQRLLQILSVFAAALKGGDAARSAAVWDQGNAVATMSLLERGALWAQMVLGVTMRYYLR